MGRIWMPGGGGGADLDVITAAADDVLKGKVIVDQDGNPLTGSLELTGNIGAADIRKGKKGYSTDPKKIITGTMAEQAAQTITPGTANKTIAAGRYLTGTQTILGDKNLIASNIIRGKTIFGVKGTAVYAGDTPGYFLEPPKEYEDLTGGWGVTDSWDSISKPSSGIYRYNFKRSAGDGYWDNEFFWTKKEIVNKYRYIYFDYDKIAITKAQNLTVTGGEAYIDFGFGSQSHTKKKITKAETFPKGTIKIDVSALQGKSDRIQIETRVDVISVMTNITATMEGYIDITAVRYDEIG